MIKLSISFCRGNSLAQQHPNNFYYLAFPILFGIKRFYPHSFKLCTSTPAPGIIAVAVCSAVIKMLRMDLCHFRKHYGISWTRLCVLPYQSPFKPAREEWNSS